MVDEAHGCAVALDCTQDERVEVMSHEKRKMIPFGCLCVVFKWLFCFGYFLFLSRVLERSSLRLYRGWITTRDSEVDLAEVSRDVR